MQTEYQNDYSLIVQTVIKVYAVNETNTFTILPKLPHEWITGLAGFIRRVQNDMPQGAIVANLLHDIFAFDRGENHETGFVPRCFIPKVSA